MMRDVLFLLRGRVNDQAFEMNGRGVGDADAGTLELHLKSEPGFPKGFDPVSCPLICSHPTSTFFARETVGGCSLASASGGQYSVDPAREGVLRDASGRELLRLQVTGRTAVDDGGRVVSENVMTGISLLPRMARNVTPVRDYIIPGEGREATAIIRYKMLTMDGAELDGQTVVPYRWDGGRPLEQPLVRLVHSIDVHWNGGDTVSAFYKVSVAPLYEAVADLGETDWQGARLPA